MRLRPQSPDLLQYSDGRNNRSIDLPNTGVKEVMQVKQVAASLASITFFTASAHLARV